MPKFERTHSVPVAAPASVVWQVLTDFAAYPQWNPFAQQVRCDFEVGGVIDMQVALVGPRLLRQREYITAISPGRSFTYAMRPLPGGLLRSQRTQTVVPVDERSSRYEASFCLQGPLAPVVKALLGRALTRGFDGVAATVGPRAEYLSRE